MDAMPRCRPKKIAEGRYPRPDGVQRRFSARNGPLEGPGPSEACARSPIVADRVVLAPPECSPNHELRLLPVVLLQGAPGFCVDCHRATRNLSDLLHYYGRDAEV